jgi:hypothetical protein
VEVIVVIFIFCKNSSDRHRNILSNEQENNQTGKSVDRTTCWFTKCCTSSWNPNNLNDLNNEDAHIFNLISGKKQQIIQLFLRLFRIFNLRASIAIIHRFFHKLLHKIFHRSVDRFVHIFSTELSPRQNFFYPHFFHNAMHRFLHKVFHRLFHRLMLH